MFSFLIGWLILFQLMLALAAFATVALTLRRLWSRVFAWTCFGVYLCVTGLAVTLIV